MPSSVPPIANARVSSPAMAAGAVRWKNDSTKLARAIANTTRRVRANDTAGRGAGIHHCTDACGAGAPPFGTMRASTHRKPTLTVKYADLRDFLAQLERRGELKRIAVGVDPHLEMTEICD